MQPLEFRHGQFHAVRCEVRCTKTLVPVMMGEQRPIDLADPELADYRAHSTTAAIDQQCPISIRQNANVAGVFEPIQLRCDGLQNPPMRLYLHQDNIPISDRAISCGVLQK